MCSIIISWKCKKAIMKGIYLSTLKLTTICLKYLNDKKVYSRLNYMFLQSV